MSIDPEVAAQLARCGRRVHRPSTAAEQTTNAHPTPRTRPYRLTVDIPPAVHAQFSRWIVDAEETLGHNVDKRAVVLALLARLDIDDELSVLIRGSMSASRRQ